MRYLFNVISVIKLKKKKIYTAIFLQIYRNVKALTIAYVTYRDNLSMHLYKDNKYL